MVDLYQDALDLQAFASARQWRFCFIGGLAVQAWGEPRLTRDVDVSILTGFGNEAPYIDALLSAYEPRMPGSREFALLNRTILIRAKSGTSIDVSLAALPFEDAMMDRAVDVELLPGEPLRICSAEDLLIMKIHAGRDIDIHDAKSIAIRQPQIDWDYVIGQLDPLDEVFGETIRLQRARHLMTLR